MQLRITMNEELQKHLLGVLGEKYANKFQVIGQNDQSVQLSIEPALFREITTLIKTEKEVYGNALVELVDEEIKR